MNKGARRTIFVSIYDGDTEKNFLRSGTFELLKRSGNKIVLLVRGADRIEYYREHFGTEDVEVELLPKAGSRAEDLWYFVGWNMLPTFGARYRRHMGLRKGSTYPRFIVGEFLGTLGHLRIFRRALRLLYALVPDSYAAELFEKYHPDLLFSPNMFSPEDFRLLRQAKRRSVKTVTTAKSWDVLTTKAFTRVKADRLLVFNEINKQEALDIGDYAACQVVVTGFPQFDVYARPEICESREMFMRRIGADPATRLILFGVPGDWKTPYTKEIIAELDRRIDAGALGPVTVLARCHPKYPDASEGLSVKHVIFDRPGAKFSGKREFSIDAGSASTTFAWTFTDADITHLANSIKHSDVVINTDSTLTLDAAANDVPAILLAYDGDHVLPYWDAIETIYNREHYRHVLATGAAPLVRSHDELGVAINAFLKNPEYLRAERNHLRDRLLYRVDGRSAERTAKAILDILT